MTILSLDPSANHLGWAILSEFPTAVCRLASGTFAPSHAKAAADRFDQLALFVASKCREGTGVDAVVIEVPDGYARRSFAQLSIYCRAVGVCEAAGVLSGRPTHRVLVSQWKGTARKAWTAIQVRAAFGYEPADHNESDACGLGIYWLEASRIVAPTQKVGSA